MKKLGWEATQDDENEEAKDPQGQSQTPSQSQSRSERVSEPNKMADGDGLCGWVDGGWYAGAQCALCVCADCCAIGAWCRTTLGAC